jgi:hypothetical protein
MEKKNQLDIDIRDIVNIQMISFLNVYLRKERKHNNSFSNFDCK